MAPNQINNLRSKVSNSGGYSDFSSQSRFRIFDHALAGGCVAFPCDLGLGQLQLLPEFVAEFMASLYEAGWF